MKTPKPIVVASTLMGLLLPAHSVGAFNIDTHRRMNTAATAASILDSYLQNELRYVCGLRTTFVDKTTTVAEWIGDGGEHEDDGSRYYHHFDDPLRSWDSAGLQLVPLTPRFDFDSSIVWMQKPQGWSWQEARGFYYAALTAGDPQTREQKSVTDHLGAELERGVVVSVQRSLGGVGQVVEKG